MKFITPWTYDYKKDRPKTKDPGKSLTVPGQALSLKEIEKRFRQGLTLGGNAIPNYLADDDTDPENFVPNWSRMDLAEREEYADYARKEIKRLKAQKEATETAYKERRIAGLKKAAEAAVAAAKAAETEAGKASSTNNP